MTAAISYPRVTQSSQARRKPHSSSGRHRSGVTPRADGEWRPRETGATAGSQAQASTVSSLILSFPPLHSVIYRVVMRKKPK